MTWYEGEIWPCVVSSYSGAVNPSMSWWRVEPPRSPPSPTRETPGGSRRISRMKTSILPEHEKFFNNDKIIEQIELTNLLFQSVPINLISLKLSAEMFLKLFHVEEFICFILLYQTIRQFGHYITATGTLRFIQKYVQVVISFDQNITILREFKPTALF